MRTDKRSKQTKQKKTNNLNFIATYLFEHPGVSATDLRRALWIYHNKEWKEIEDKGFSIRKTYTSYFQIAKGKSHRGYAGKYWKKINRNSWILTSDGLFYVDKRLIKKVATVNKKVLKYKKMCRSGTR